jgi:hypothetical protein
MDSSTMDGLWTAEFGSTNGIFGGGVDVFREGEVLGGDGTYDYVGKYTLNANALEAVTEKLSLENALEVWDKAGIAERRQLLPLIYAKIAKWQESAANSGKPPAQLQDARNRIADFRRSLAQ